MAIDPQQFTSVMQQRESRIHHKQQLDRMTSLEKSVISSMRQLVQFLDGKTTKTEVVNQLKEIGTPDIDKVVKALETLDSSVTNSKIDLTPLQDGLSALEKQLKQLPTSFPEAPEGVEAVTVKNQIDLSPLEKAIKALKLDPKIVVKAPDVNVETDLKPLQNSLLDVIKSIKAQDFPKTDLSNVEKKLDESNKHLKKLIDKPVGGGGGGGGNGTPYIDATGRAVNVTLTAGGQIPVSASLASAPEYIKLAGSDANQRDSTFYGDGLTTGIAAVHQRHFDGVAYNRTPASKTLVDKTTANIIYIGKAPTGTALSAATWQIKKIDKTVTDTITMTFGNAGAFTNVWNTRTSGTYS